METTVIETNQEFRIKIPKSEVTLREKIKSIPGSVWHMKQRDWVVPKNPVSRNILISCKLLKQEKQVIKNRQLPRLNRIILRDYQETGVRFLLSRDKAILADDMGLGKTIQAITCMLARNQYPVLILCPASVKKDWEIAIKEQSPKKKIEILQGKKPYDIDRKTDIVIINYDVIQTWKTWIENFSFKQAIFDECHYIKNPKTLRSRAVYGDLQKNIPGFVQSIKFVIALSGTPLEIKPKEIYPMLRVVAGKCIPAFFPFGLRYCAGVKGPFGWDFDGASNLDELKLLTSDWLLRRNKIDVEKSLPKKTRKITYLDIGEKALKKLDAIPHNLEKKLKKEIKQAKTETAKKTAIKKYNALGLTIVQTLIQETWNIKKKMVLSAIRDTLESGEKIIIFAKYHEAIDYLYDNLQDYNPLKYDGRCTANEKQEIKDKFQTDIKHKVIICSIRATTGITLTASRIVLFANMDYNPARLEQAEDRSFRIGQTRPVFVNYLLGHKTIESKIYELVEKRRKNIDNILDGRSKASKSILKEITNKYLIGDVS